MPYTVYILRTNKNSLYIGITNNLKKRLHTHASKTKQAAKYMKAFSSFVLVYNEQVDTKSDALKREYQLKQLTKNQKEKFIMQQSANVANLP